MCDTGGEVALLQKIRKVSKGCPDNGDQEEPDAIVCEKSCKCVGVLTEYRIMRGRLHKDVHRHRAKRDENELGEGDDMSHGFDSLGIGSALGKTAVRRICSAGNANIRARSLKIPVF